MKDAVSTINLTFDKVHSKCERKLAATSEPSLLCQKKINDE